MTTTPNYGAGTGSSGTAPGTSAAGRAQQTAGTAADQSKHVAGVAKDEAKQVVGQAKDQAQNLMGEAKSQLDAQSRTQRDRLVGTLQSFSDDLDQMTSRSEESGMATGLAREASSRARQLGTRLEGREPSDLLEDVRSFARRKPGTFLVGALAAGMIAGRVTRGAKEGRDDDSSMDRWATDPVADARGTAGGYPIAGTEFPEPDPVIPAGASDSGFSAQADLAPTAEADVAPGSEAVPGAPTDSSWTETARNRGTL